MLDIEQGLDHFSAVFGEPRPVRDTAIENFMQEFRELAKSRPQLNERHLKFIQSMLVSLHEAAGESGALMDLWDKVRSLISDTSMSVKERLAGLDPIGDRLIEQHRGRAH
jgi:hypothetical protein